MPSEPQAVSGDTEQGSQLERGALALFKQLGLAVLAAILDFISLCRASDPSCGDYGFHAQHVYTLRADLEQQMVGLCSAYVPDNGARSAVIRAARNLQSDLDRFAASAGDAGGLLASAAELARTVGLRGRMLAYILGVHFWVRTLVVPGRGAPVFILHDDYTSWPDMLRTLVGNFARNGEPGITLVEVGLAPEAHQRELLAEFRGVQYVGVFLDDEEASALERDSGYNRFLQLKTDLKEFAGRAVLHYATSFALASVIPLKALDMAFVNVGGKAGDIEKELEMWEARVKPGGVLAGRGFGPDWPEAVRAVCARRFSNDIHLGAGGGFWWFVEPEEE